MINRQVIRVEQGQGQILGDAGGDRLCSKAGHVYTDPEGSIVKIRPNEVHNNGRS